MNVTEKKYYEAYLEKIGSQILDGKYLSDS